MSCHSAAELPAATIFGAARRLATVVILALGLAASPALAEDSKPQIYGRIGGFAMSTDTKVRIDDAVADRFGTVLDIEDDLNFNSKKSVLHFDIGARLSDKWALEFRYFDISRSSSASVSHEIRVDDEIFPIEAMVEGTFNSSLYHGKLVWTPIDWDGGDLSFSLGLHATDFNISVSGDIDPGGSTGEIVTVSKSQLLPLPALGARAQTGIGANLSIFGQGELFALEVDEVRGALVDAEAGLVWQVDKNIGIGASWALLHYRLTLNKPSYTGKIEYDLSGPRLFLTLGF